MTYIKHPEHGNRHVSPEEAEKLVSEGWVIWPRSKEAKAGFVQSAVNLASDDIPTLIPTRRPGRPRKAE